MPLPAPDSNGEVIGCCSWATYEPYRFPARLQTLQAESSCETPPRESPTGVPPGESMDNEILEPMDVNDAWFDHVAVLPGVRVGALWISGRRGSPRVRSCEREDDGEQWNGP